MRPGARSPPVRPSSRSLRASPLVETVTPRFPCRDRARRPLRRRRRGADGADRAPAPARATLPSSARWAASARDALFIAAVELTPLRRLGILLGIGLGIAIPVPHRARPRPRLLHRHRLQPDRHPLASRSPRSPSGSSSSSARPCCSWACGRGAHGSTASCGSENADARRHILVAWELSSRSPRCTSGIRPHAILCDNLVKIYKVADLEVVALQGLDLVVEQGELIAIVGASGSGKSTLQNILGGVDTPTAGRVEVAGLDLTVLSERERTLYRRRVVGFVWQQTSRNLLPVPDGGRERRAADDARRRRAEARQRARARAARARRSRRTAPTTAPTRSRAASSSASRSRSRSRTSRASCSPTSRPASSTARTRASSSRRCERSTSELGVTDRRPHSRPAVSRAGSAHDRDSRRPHGDGDAPAT